MQDAELIFRMMLHGLDDVVKPGQDEQSLWY